MDANATTTNFFDSPEYYQELKLHKSVQTLSEWAPTFADIDAEYNGYNQYTAGTREY